MAGEFLVPKGELAVISLLTGHDTKLPSKCFSVCPWFVPALFYAKWMMANRELLGPGGGGEQSG